MSQPITTWAMQIVGTGYWQAIEPAQAVQAIEYGIPVRLTDTQWLLDEAWKRGEV